MKEIYLFIYFLIVYDCLAETTTVCDANMSAALM